MPTKAELKQKAAPAKLKVRLGDSVVIIAGKDKGERGFVAKVLTKKNRVIVLKQNEEAPDMPLPLNAAIKHRKAKMQGEKSARVRMPMPIHISNIMVLDPKDGTPSRVGRRTEEGKLVRYAKKSGVVIPDPLKAAQ